MTSPLNPRPKIAKQQGAVLIVTLVLLTLMTLAALTTTQDVMLQEKMAAHAYDRNLALQAAEAALQEAEELAETQSKSPPPNNGFPCATACPPNLHGVFSDVDNSCPANAINNCANGLCPSPDKDCQERWKAPGFNGWRNSAVVLSALAGPPKYIIEYLGGTFPCITGNGFDPMNCKRYRITASSQAHEERAAVVIQSIYATD